MAESTKISALIRGIPKFDGNPIKYEDWKATTLAVLEISRNDMFEILTGESTRPQEQFISTQQPRVEDTVPSTGTVQVSSSDTAGSSEKVVDTTAQPKTGTETPAPASTTTHSPARIEMTPGDTSTASPLNTIEIKEWEKTNAALYSVLYLVTSGAARCLLRQFETKNGRKADGREAWLALSRKYQNTSSHRRQALMACLLYTSPSPRDRTRSRMPSSA